MISIWIKMTLRCRNIRRVNNMSGTPNVTRSTFIEFYDRYLAATIVMERANAEMRATKRAAKAAGIDVKELITSYKLALQDRDTRDEAFDTRRRYMSWLGKPLGSQGELDLSTGAGESPEDLAAAEKLALAEAYQSGYVAGKSGAGGAFCTFDAGTEAHQQYMLGVSVGTQMHETLHPPGEKKAERIGGIVVKRGRGRPRKDAGFQNQSVGDSSVVSIDFGNQAAVAAQAGE